MANSKKGCQNELCGYPFVESGRCPCCSAPQGQKDYPFVRNQKLKIKLAASGTAIVLIAMAAVWLSMFISARDRENTRKTQTAAALHAQATALRMTEVAMTPLCTRLGQNPALPSPVTIPVEPGKSTRTLTEGTLLLEMQVPLWASLSTIKVRQQADEILNIPASELDDIDSPRLSPDGQWLAYVGLVNGHRELTLRSITNGTDVRTTNTADNYEVNKFAWSPDSTQLAITASYGSQTTLQIVDIILNTSSDNLDRGYIGPIDWSRTGVLAYVVDNQSQYVLRLQFKGYVLGCENQIVDLPLTFLDPKQNIVQAVRWSPDVTRNTLALVVANRSASEKPSELYILDLMEPITLDQVAVAVGSHTAAIWTPESNLIFVDPHGSAFWLDIDRQQKRGTYYAINQIEPDLKSIDLVGGN